MKLTHRRARLDDLSDIVSLLVQDDLGKVREQFSDVLDKRYIDAFHKINNDPNQHLMVVERENKTIGTCHLTMMPSMTFTGSTRMQIEAVRVHPDARGERIGEQMIKVAIDYGKAHGASIFQLSTNKQRHDALRFYENLGFKATHEGMKLYLE